MELTSSRTRKTETVFTLKIAVAVCSGNLKDLIPVSCSTAGISCVSGKLGEGRS